MISASSSASRGYSASPSSSRSASACSSQGSTSSPGFSLVTPAGDATQTEPVSELVAELRRYERTLREAFASGGRLAAAAAAAQQHQGISVTYGAKIFGLLGTANVDVSRAIATVADAHRALEAVGRTLGIRAEDFGPEQPKPGPGADFFIGADARRADVAA